MLRNPLNRILVPISFVALFLISGELSLAVEYNYPGFIKNVSEGILRLKGAYPQLKGFSIDRHVDIQNLRIDYSYRTHTPERSGGWTSGVPNPDPDGVWLYIDLHDKDSMAQIHTQPITGASYEFGAKAICFLILEGSETTPMWGDIVSILKRNGALLKKP